MKIPRRTFEIDVIPKGTEPIQHLTLSVRKAWLWISAIALSIGVWFLLVWSWPVLLSLWSDPAVAVLERENLALQGTLDQLNYHSAAMASRLEQISQQQQRVAGLTNLPASFPSLSPLAKPKNGDEALRKAKELEAISREGKQWLSAPEKIGEKLPVVPPFRTPHFVSVPFGARLDPFTGRRMMHEGIDFPGSIGDTIVAPADGIVQFPSLHGGYGSAIRVDHDGGISTIYTHLERALVSPGRSVRRGTPIALLGNSGRSSAPHLHYEVRRNGVPVDPLLLLFDLSTIFPITPKEAAS